MSQNVVERDGVLAELIDHPRHIGFVCDLFGEQLMLHQSEIFIRPGHGRHDSPPLTYDPRTAGPRVLALSDLAAAARLVSNQERVAGARTG